jgi:hypothetical protein
VVLRMANDCPASAAKTPPILVENQLMKWTIPSSSFLMSRTERIGVLPLCRSKLASCCWKMEHLSQDIFTKGHDQLGVSYPSNEKSLTYSRWEGPPNGGIARRLS